MRLKDFFRQYSRGLLMVFLAALLVIWLVGDTTGRMVSQRARKLVIGEAFGQTLTTVDTDAAQLDMKIAQRLGMPDFANNDPIVYAILTREVRQFGLTVSRGTVREKLKQGGVTDAMINAIRNETGRGLNEIYDSIGTYMAIQQLAMINAESVNESLPRLELGYRDSDQQAVVKLAVLESRAFKPLVPAPDEAALQEFFDKAKDRVKSSSETSVQYGYRVPDRVRIEYLTVDPAEAQLIVRVSEREARRYYEDNLVRYQQQVQQATSRPAAQVTFEQLPADVQTRVKEDCRAAKATEEAGRLLNKIAADLSRPWVEAGVGEDGFHRPPPPERTPAFEAVREQYSRELPVKHVKLELTAIDELPRIPGFGQAQFNYSGARINTQMLAARVNGLYKPGNTEQLPVLNLNEPSPALFDTRPDMVARQQRPHQGFVFKITEVVPSGPPPSLDAVREDVVRDWTMTKAHEIAGEWARKLAEAARSPGPDGKPVGLSAAVEALSDLKTILADADAAWAASTQPASAPATQPRPEDRRPINAVTALGPHTVDEFRRRPHVLPHLPRCASLHEELFRIADGLATQPAQPRVVVGQNASVQKWAVAELEEVKPLYGGSFDAQRSQLLMQESFQNARQVMQFWFEPGNIAARAGFKPAGGAGGT